MGLIEGRDAGTFAKERPKEMRRFKIIMDIVRPRKTDVVLDAAAGSGEFSKLLVSRVKHLTLVDLSDEMVGMLQKRFSRNKKVEVIKSDVTNLDLPGNHFDLVFFNSALHHIKDKRKAISELFRVLKRGGGLIIFDAFDRRSFLERLVYPLKWELYIKHKLAWRESCPMNATEGEMLSILDELGAGRVEVYFIKETPEPWFPKGLVHELYVATKG